MPEVRVVSFRDPAGSVLFIGNRVFRIVEPSAIPTLNHFLSTTVAQRSIASGQFVNTTILADAEVQRVFEMLPLDRAETRVLIEHDRIPFQSFPYEWPAEMLSAAARLTLDLANELLDEGLGLKDATPYNILFKGTQPVFVDALSVEEREPNDPIWLPLGQFTRTFLLPLFLDRYFGIHTSRSLLWNGDGPTIEEVQRLCSPLRAVLPPALRLVTVPHVLDRMLSFKPEFYRQRKVRDPARARFTLQLLLRRARKDLERLSPSNDRYSAWSGYTDCRNYGEESTAVKRSFVTDSLRRSTAGEVLDLGCNTGEFSLLAAEIGASVVSIDRDPIVIGALYRRAKAGNHSILPLVADIANPSPASGWRNEERPSFLSRARNRFDTVLMLGILHHLLVTDRIPLREVLKLAAEMTTRSAVVEFILPADRRFQQLCRGRQSLFTGLSVDSFEASCREYFEIDRKLQLPGTVRWMYALRKK